MGIPDLKATKSLFPCPRWRCPSADIDMERISKYLFSTGIAPRSWPPERTWASSSFDSFSPAHPPGWSPDHDSGRVPQQRASFWNQSEIVLVRPRHLPSHQRPSGTAQDVQYMLLLCLALCDDHSRAKSVPRPWEARLCDMAPGCCIEVHAPRRVGKYGDHQHDDQRPLHLNLHPDATVHSLQRLAVRSESGHRSSRQIDNTHRLPVGADEDLHIDRPTLERVSQLSAIGLFGLFPCPGSLCSGVPMTKEGATRRGSLLVPSLACSLSGTAI
ncbi:hypothetical protein F5X68DRAFT_72050 [Plectosphaerella plurivora]|uniref:Uncharacterized protein n=1 Tax=Plectosphaerella plurivora TaxID=936078 RepID=A0A9P8VGF6_9PEZI|nr:hypothetical protein F5X68DRAFT_72050 [Plectosphaerella plurivora]